MNGAHQIVIRSDPRERDLYRARFGSRKPTVGVQGGELQSRIYEIAADRYEVFIAGGANNLSIEQW